MKKHFHELSVGQQLVWWLASAVFGFFVVYFPHKFDPDLVTAESYPALLVLALCWALGVVGIRLYIQDKDPTNFRQLVGLEAPGEVADDKAGRPR